MTSVMIFFAGTLVGVLLAMTCQRFKDWYQVRRVTQMRNQFLNEMQISPDSYLDISAERYR